MTRFESPADRAQQAMETAQRAADDLREQAGVVDLRAAFVLGSGWADAADAIGEVVHRLAVTDLPGFVAPAASGHTGEILVVRGQRRSALVFVGRTHLYEGHGPAAVVHGVRTAAAAGCDTVVLTNAAGSLTADLPVGVPALIADHVNLTATSPLVGAEFVDMSDVYSARLRELCQRLDPSLGEGVYGGWFGPAFETPAEIRMLRAVGCDLVGMSTVLEATAARSLGMEVLGLSLVTNPAAGMADQKLGAEEILAVAKEAVPRLRTLLGGIADELIGPAA